MAEKTARPRESDPDVKSRGWLADLALRFVYFVFHTVWLLVFCGLVFVLAGGASYWIVKREIGGGEIAVISVLGLRPNEALQALQRQGVDLALKIEAYQPMPGHAAGTIFEQTPPSGRTVKAGSVLRVKVARGSKQVAAPSVVGRNYRDAAIALREAQLDLGNRAWAPSGKVPREGVIAQDPPAGTPMDPGDKVNLLISAGLDERGRTE